MNFVCHENLRDWDYTRRIDSTRKQIPEKLTPRHVVISRFPVADNAVSKDLALRHALL